MESKHLALGHTRKNARKTATVEKKRHTAKSLVISDHQRRILFVSPVFGGSMHDYVIMNRFFALSAGLWNLKIY